MIQSFSYVQPMGIEFGAGARKQLPELLNRYGRRVLLITGCRWFNQSGWKREFLALLKNFQYYQLSCPGGEPSSEGLEELLNQARGFDPEVILAVGGGSVLDTAKAISGLLPLNDRVDDFLEGVGRGLKITEAGIPWLAVPTTSGTGAEVTKNAVIKSRARGLKRSLRSPYLISALAVVDPELILECPLRVSGIAGLDALSQLIESFVSRRSKPVPRALIRSAFPLMLKALKVIPENLSDLAARTGAAYGAMISGLALSNSGLGAAHGFASGLGGLYDIPHGLICALFIGPVLKVNGELIRKDCEILVREAGAPAECDPIEWLSAEIEALLSAFKLPSDLRSYSVSPERVAEIAGRSAGSSMSGNPRELSLQEREELIRGLI
ncbi:Alcohol dehydrogenase 2 [subsurface metagenome]